jgi:hypothetical protein
METKIEKENRIKKEKLRVKKHIIEMKKKFSYDDLLSLIEGICNTIYFQNNDTDDFLEYCEEEGLYDSEW